MLGEKIADTLLNNAAVLDYCGRNVWTDQSPDGTTCPYIVIETDEGRDESDVIATFEITITIYDVNADKRPMRKATRAIKNALHYETFDAAGIFENVRVWFEGAITASGGDPNLTITTIDFNARACNTENL